MLFIDLNKMKIIKDYHYETISGNLDFDFENAPLLSKNDDLVNFFKEIIKPSPLAVSYEIRINGEGETTDDEARDFLSAVNMLTMIFFNNLIKDEGRQREHRLDVPEKLKIVKVSRIALKKCINQKTINDIFNLTVYYKDLIYKLCDEKDFKEEEDA